MTVDLKSQHWRRDSYMKMFHDFHFARAFFPRARPPLPHRLGQRALSLAKPTDAQVFRHAARRMRPPDLRIVK
jgi:hypothetical protein